MTGSDDPLRLAPEMLSPEHAAQLAEHLGALLEHTQDGFAVGDRESDPGLFATAGLLERGGRRIDAGVPESTRELEREAIGNGETGKYHGMIEHTSGVA